MTNKIIAMCISIIAMLITIASFQFKNKKHLLTMQTLGSALYLISFAFSGSGIAVLLNIIYIIRNFTVMNINTEGKKGRIICAVLCTAYFCAFGITILNDGISAETLWNILPVLGSCLGTVGFINNNPAKLRLWKMGDSFLWLGFNFYIGLGALGGIIGEVLNISSNIISIFRFKEKNQ